MVGKKAKSKTPPPLVGGGRGEGVVGGGHEPSEPLRAETPSHKGSQKDFVLIAFAVAIAGRHHRPNRSGIAANVRKSISYTALPGGLRRTTMAENGSSDAIFGSFLQFDLFRKIVPLCRKKEF